MKLFTALSISGGSLVNTVLALIIAGIIIWLLIWLIANSPLPPPFKNVLTWLCYVVAVLLLINFLMGLMGSPFITF